MEDMSFVKVVHVFTGNNIDFAIPFQIKILKTFNPFLLLRLQPAEIFEYYIHAL
jgi:hypothetical protein